MDQARTATALAAERAAVLDQLDALQADVGEVIAAAAGSNLDDEHDPEGATIAFEREQLAALRDRAREHLSRVDAALARLATGTYGLCARCGDPIAVDRLVARPSAPDCVRCARRRSPTGR